MSASAPDQHTVSWGTAAVLLRARLPTFAKTAEMYVAARTHADAANSGGPHAPALSRKGGINNNGSVTHLC